MDPTTPPPADTATYGTTPSRADALSRLGIYAVGKRIVGVQVDEDGDASLILEDDRHVVLHTDGHLSIVASRALPHEAEQIRARRDTLDRVGLPVSLLPAPGDVPGWNRPVARIGAVITQDGADPLYRLEWPDGRVDPVLYHRSQLVPYEIRSAVA